jgi:predicted  nucleic acid-binding Zn-ribbon protein
MSNSDEITLPLTEDIAEEDAPSTVPLLKELLSDFRAERTANQEFRVKVLERLDRLEQRADATEAELHTIKQQLNGNEADLHTIKQQLNRIEIKLDKLNHNQLDLFADIVMVGKRVDQLEQAA